MEMSYNEVYLYRDVPLSFNKERTRWFESYEEQRSYFARKLVYSSQNLSIVRDKRNSVKVDIGSNDVRHISYMAFRNVDLDNKYIYCFITSINYVNENTYEIEFEVDYIQSYMFDFVIKNSYVEREHTNMWENGLPVINTVQEDISIGDEYVERSVSRNFRNNDFSFILIFATKDFTGTDTYQYVNQIGIVPQPLYCYILPIDNRKDFLGETGIVYSDGTVDTIKRVEVQHFIKEICFNEKYNLVNSIVSLNIVDYLPTDYTVERRPNGDTEVVFREGIRPCPTVIEKAQGSTEYNEKYKVGLFNTQVFKEHFETLVPNVYSPMNYTSETKMFFYPYSYYEITDSEGGQIIIKPEFTNGKIEMKLQQTINSSAKSIYMPVNYKGSTSIANALICVSDNSIPVVTDYSAEYLQMNRYQNATGIISGVASSLVGGFLSSPSGVVNGISEVVGVIAKQKDIKNVPPNLQQQGNDPFIKYGFQKQGVEVRLMSISDEYIRINENFFKKFGYKIARIKYPNIHTRQNWNYVKMIDCVIGGSISSTVRTEIENIFNTGITLWHTDDVGNYALSNNEI